MEVQIIHSILTLLIPVLLCVMLLIPAFFHIFEMRRIITDQQHQLDDLKRRLEDLEKRE